MIHMNVGLNPDLPFLMKPIACNVGAKHDRTRPENIHYSIKTHHCFAALRTKPF